VGQVNESIAPRLCPPSRSSSLSLHRSNPVSGMEARCDPMGNPCTQWTVLMGNIIYGGFSIAMLSHDSSRSCLSHVASLYLSLAFSQFQYPACTEASVGSATSTDSCQAGSNATSIGTISPIWNAVPTAPSQSPSIPLPRNRSLGLQAASWLLGSAHLYDVLNVLK